MTIRIEKDAREPVGNVVSAKPEEPHEPEAFEPAAGPVGPALGIYLDPAMDTGEAFVLICRKLLDTMLSHEEGVRRDVDPKFLHDFRVAARRTRSALSLMGDVIELQILDHFRREFKWLGSVTGCVRDLDVHLLQMDDYYASLPEAIGNDLVSLERYLRRHRSIEQRRMLAALDSKRYRDLVSSWDEFLDCSTAKIRFEQVSRKPIMDVAAQSIWHAYRKVRKRAGAITPDSPAGALHRLRLDCKKLRYLVEFFHSLFDPIEIRPLIKVLKRLQDNLGDFNDLVVHETLLYRIAREMEHENLATVDCLLAMGRLLANHHEDQRTARPRIAKSIARFDMPRNRDRFRRIFNPNAADRQ